MMKITRDNYEAYFLDYLDGTLDENLVDDFIDFLRKNPDLKAELKKAGSLNMELENVYFKGKNKLYKEKYDLENEFNHAAIAHLEGDIEEEETADFAAYLSIHPEKQKETALFEKTKLQADQSIVFRKKNKLYHHSAGRNILIWSTRIAAVLILAFIVYQFADNFSTNHLMHENNVAVSGTKSKQEASESASLPEKTETLQDIVPGNEKTDHPVNKAEPKPTKILREYATDQMVHEKIAEARMVVESPGKIESRTASLLVEQPVVTLAAIKINQPEIPVNQQKERLLADIVKEKTGINNLSLNKVTKIGLNLVSTFSKEKFNFKTNPDGEITELSYDSRLLAFSIPTKND